jgi:hypothetical protein
METSKTKKANIRRGPKVEIYKVIVLKFKIKYLAQYLMV